ncbi:MAG: hypothetical protein FWF15_10530 [Oscillospiraceae bacterium]|nr:hypothetical protein [Oscillospiraceae bacterium]
MFNKKNLSVTETWRQYESGKDYKYSINLYDTVNENERFYRGDQWSGINTNGLTTPVFNVVKKIVNFLVNSIISNNISVVYSDEDMIYTGNSADTERIRHAVGLLNKSVAYRWEKCKIDHLLRKSVYDAAISGDAVFYTYWDSDLKTGQPYTGDIVTTLVDNVNLFVADVNSTNLQTQDYIIIAGRATVESLKREATVCGLPDADIRADTDTEEQAGDLAVFENDDKATYLIKFTRDENGLVQWEKSVRNAVIKQVKTEMKLYPVAYYNWETTKNSFHGTSAAAGLIQNQKYINKAYAMAMKHMSDTAFSKVIYDRKLIPEWTNEVGQAIGVISGGDVSNAVKIVGTGEMQSEFMPLLENVMEQTKLIVGVTDSAIGETDPNNTSAILALQEASSISFEYIKSNIYQCIEDTANIWLDMMCCYYDDERFINVREPEKFDISKLKGALVKARVDVGTSTRFSKIAQLGTLDKLLAAGHINFKQYLERLPDGIISDKAGLMDTNPTA